MQCLGLEELQNVDDKEHNSEWYASSIQVVYKWYTSGIQIEYQGYKRGLGIYRKMYYASLSGIQV